MPEYLVRYKRVGPHRGLSQFVSAPSIARLEEPIKDNVRQILRNPDKQMTVSITDENADPIVGQLDYGLLGEFEVDKDEF